MTVQLATSDAEIAACYPVMHELRPHIEEKAFVARVRAQESAGYRLAFVLAVQGPVAVAGFRIGENLAWDRFLYVDDLVTMNSQRSKGYGAKLLAWLKVYAADENCKQLHLDSGLQRKDAHRFYKREGMGATGYHFAATLGGSVLE